MTSIIIRDGFSLSTFTDPNLARQVYEFDLKAGEDVAFNKKHNAYIKRYGSMKRAKIVEELKKQIVKAGGTIVNEK